MDLVTMILACSMYSNNSITNAMVQLGSNNNPYSVSTADGQTQNFTSQVDALNYINSQINKGNSVNIGLMQIPSRWLKSYAVTPTDILRPCKNLVIATQILNDAYAKCSLQKAQDSSNMDLPTCALSIYETGDPQSGTDFANKVITYANAHSFDDIVAALKAKNPSEFSMLPGDMPTTISTPNAASVNPSTDPSIKKPTQ